MSETAATTPAGDVGDVGDVKADAAAGDLSSLGYEQARDALVDVVRRLETGGATLEESLALWERGEALAARCEQWLAGARARVETAQEQRGD